MLIPSTALLQATWIPVVIIVVIIVISVCVSALYVSMHHRIHTLCAIGTFSPSTSTV